ncbi:MAG: hypothetical protein WBD47_07050 [Phormidesmis sp.]
MATDQATADYEREQENRAALQDDWTDWAESEIPSPPSQLMSRICDRCVNWQPARHLYLADGTTQLTPGFCAVRAAAGLRQRPQAYAEHCRFYEEEIPF